MKLEYFTKLPIVELVFGKTEIEGLKRGKNAYLRASDIVAIEEASLLDGALEYTRVTSNAINEGGMYFLTSLSPAEVVTEIARANDAVKADAEREMEEMMAKMQGTRSLTDSVYGDAN